MTSEESHRPASLFLVRLADEWRKLLTGSFAIVALGFIERWLQKTVTLWFYVVLAALLLLYASYRVWRNEHLEVNRLKDLLGKTESEAQRAERTRKEQEEVQQRRDREARIDRVVERWRDAQGGLDINRLITCGATSLHSNDELQDARRKIQEQTADDPFCGYAPFLDGIYALADLKEWMASGEAIRGDLAVFLNKKRAERGLQPAKQLDRR